MISRFVFVFGCMLILHAAYSLQHYRSLVKDLIESSIGTSIDVDDANGDATPQQLLPKPPVTYRIPPFDIYVELGIAFAMILVSELVRSGSSIERAVYVKGEKSKHQTPKHSIVGAPFISRDFDIYTTRKSKLQ